MSNARNTLKITKTPKVYRSPKELRRAYIKALLNLDFAPDPMTGGINTVRSVFEASITTTVVPVQPRANHSAATRIPMRHHNRHV